MKPWPKRRRKELELLREVLWQASGINRGSNAVARILFLERNCKRLTQCDLNRNRPSLLRWLEQQACGEAPIKHTGAPAPQPKGATA